MGSAFCRGLKAKGIAYEVSEKKKERIEALQAETGRAPLTAGELLRRTDIILLAVKPQEFDRLRKELSSQAAGKRFVSILAGKSIATLTLSLGSESVCRFMPNLAAGEGKAAVGVSFADGVAEDFKKACITLAQAVGEAFPIPENLMSAFTGLSGSGIAYVFSFLHALALGGAATGIRYDDALRIALATVEGAVATIRNSGVHPVELLSRVVSPAGTTIQGVRRLESEGFCGSVLKAVEDAARRAAELES
jgi:pyrroline-5-carboxylate reductase